MKAPANLNGFQNPGEGEKKKIISELWHACAGPLVSLPPVGSLVVYFPQGHSEQVAASMQKETDGIPNYPSLPSKLICVLLNVTLHADTETDEVYAQMTLQPVNKCDKEALLASDLGLKQSKQPTEFFCKTLTASDTSTHGGFSVPRRAAEKIFPPLDFSMQPPAQELVAKDLHGAAWTFRHIYRGQPKRHLLTTGWSVFVSTKRLFAGDSVLFIRDEKSQLLLGIRRANRQQPALSSSVLSSDSMHIGILAAAAHAAANNSPFTVFYNPRASPSEFVIPLAKYNKAMYTQVSLGMRFRMMFETEESGVRRYMGTITGIGDLDPIRWKNSEWRKLQVGWDESTAGERPNRVSIWEIEPVTSPFYICPPPFLRPKFPRQPGMPDDESEIENAFKRAMPWLGDDIGIKDAQSPLFPGFSLVQWMSMQQQNPQLIGSAAQSGYFPSMVAPALQNNLSPKDSSKLLSFQAQAIPPPGSNSNLPKNEQIDRADQFQQLPLKWPQQLQQHHQPPPIIPQQLQQHHQPPPIIPQQLQQQQQQRQHHHHQEQQATPPPPLLLQQQQQQQLRPTVMSTGVVDQSQQKQQQSFVSEHQNQLLQQSLLQSQLQQQQRFLTPNTHTQLQQQNILQQLQQQNILQQPSQNPLQSTTLPQNLQFQQQLQQLQQLPLSQQHLQLQLLQKLQQQQQLLSQLSPHLQPQLQQQQLQLQQQQQQQQQHQQEQQQRPQQQQQQTHQFQQSQLQQQQQTHQFQQSQLQQQQQTHQFQQSQLQQQQQQQQQLNNSHFSQSSLNQLQHFSSNNVLSHTKGQLPIRANSGPTNGDAPSCSTSPSTTNCPVSSSSLLNRTSQGPAVVLVDDMTAQPVNNSTQELCAKSNNQIKNEWSTAKDTDQLAYRSAITDHLEASSSATSFCLDGSLQQNSPVPAFCLDGEVQPDSRNNVLFGVNIDGMTPDTLLSRGFDSGKDLQNLLSGYSNQRDIETELSTAAISSQSFGVPDMSFKPGCSSDAIVNENGALNRGVWGNQSQRMRTYTKVQKRGSVGRSIDVTRYRGYDELRHDLARMFGIEGLLEDPHGSEWKLVYVDHENDILLVGDDPWEEFVSCVQSIKILSAAEVQQMSLNGDLVNLPLQNQACSGSDNGNAWKVHYDDNSVTSFDR